MSSSTIRSYRDLQVWQKAMDLVESCYRATDSFPAAERYGLVSQIRRAAVSVVSNIAEADARSRGDFRLMSNDQARPLLRACDEVGRMVGGLRRRIQARRSLGPSSKPY
jgi:hypothetical protein